MTHLAIMAWDGGNRVTKHQPCPDEAAATAHVQENIGNYPDAFVAADPGGDVDDWVVEPVGQTVSLDTVGELTKAKAARVTLLDGEAKSRLTVFRYDDGGGEVIYENDYRLMFPLLIALSLNIALNGTTLAANFKWPDQARAKHTFGDAGFKAYVGALTTHYVAVLTNWFTKQTAIESATTVAEVGAVDITAGWPATSV